MLDKPTPDFLALLGALLDRQVEFIVDRVGLADPPSRVNHRVVADLVPEFEHARRKAPLYVPA